MTTRSEFVVRVLLGVLLLWAGGAKLAEPKLFFFTLLEYRLPLPDGALRFVAVMLPWLELLCGAFLVTDTWAGSVRALTAGLCAVFIVATAQAWLRGLEISCGCFGALESGEWGTPAVALARAVLLGAAAVWLLARLGRKKSSA